MEIKIDGDLVLKQLSIDYAEEIFSVVDENRSHLREWLPWLDYNTTSKDTLSFLEGVEKTSAENKSVQFAIFFEGKIVGIIGQHDVSWANKFTTIGYWLAKGYNGKGIMTRSLRAIAKYSFEEQGLNLVTLAAAKENSKSRAVAERVGFQFEGIVRQREWLYDHFVDHAKYSLLKEELK